MHVDSHVPVGLDKFHIHPINSEWGGLGLVCCKVHHRVLHLLHFQLRPFLSSPMHKLVNQALVLIFPSILHMEKGWQLRISADDMSQFCTEKQKCRWGTENWTPQFPRGPSCCRSDVQTHSALVLQTVFCLSGSPSSMQSD